ncbi:hypothetical protein B6K85_19020 [Vibrio sp. V1B]|nr:hypothetical protein SN10_18615 [Vibrio harveyi]KIP78399.1 hypothetical protein SN11_07735 [Vibrio harveyi]PAW09082.1 hypothetical protein B6K85_19020 [Vibrio sp. V1B]
MNFSRHIFIFAQVLIGEVLATSISTNRSKKEQHQNGVENLSRRMLPKSVIKFKNDRDNDRQM